MELISIAVTVVLILLAKENMTERILISISPIPKPPTIIGTFTFFIDFRNSMPYTIFNK